jgi:hypothetical protein
MAKKLFLCFIKLNLALIIFSCSSTPMPHADQTKIPDDFFGIVHAGITRTPEEYRLLEEMGVNWILRTFYWNDIEKEKGIFDFSGYDEYVEIALRENKKVIAVLAYETSWLYPDGKHKNHISPNEIPIFLNYVEKTVNHFKGKIDTWEIWNEPNFMFWKGSRNDFFELSKQTAIKIRETDSNAYILGGAFWRAPGGFIKAMHKAGGFDNIDAVAFHPYAVNPSGSMKVYDKFLNVLSEINYTGPIWITEAGYPTAGWYPTKVSLKEFPSYVVKTIVGAATRGPRVLLWYQLFDFYNLKETPFIKFDSEKFFGLAYPDYQKKSGAFAYELCAKYLPGSIYTDNLPLKENVPSSIVCFCFLGGTPGNNTLIIWNDSIITQKLKIQIQSPALLHDISSGNSVQMPSELKVGKEPLFITWTGDSIPRLLK